MKTTHILQAFLLFLLSGSLTAQQGINYKAIIHDDNGDALANTTVTVQFTILENGTTEVYKESHNPTTDVNGIIIVNIGEGTTISGDYSTIDWGSNLHYLKTEINTGSGLTNMGTTEFKTVPYALYAASGNEGPQGIQGEPGDTKWSEVTEGISYTDGRVGIGTTTPTTLLHVNGPPVDYRGQLSLSSPTGQDVWLSYYEGGDYKAYLWWNASEDDLVLQNHTGGDLNLNPYNGNVGIGTNAPDAKLHVDGDLHVTGDIITAGTAEQEISVSDLLDLLNNQGILPNNYAGNVTDIDGNMYSTVKIGDQIWMAENLKVSHLNDGTPLDLVEISEDQNGWYRYSGDYCWYDNDSITYESVYGKLYTFKATRSYKLCPADWHVPTADDWVEFLEYLGQPAGGKLKDTGTNHWNPPNIGATNESGFSALPGGYLWRSYDFPVPIEFKGEGDRGFWWSFDDGHIIVDDYPYKLWGISLISDFEGVNYTDDEDHSVYISRSVRCIKD